MSICKYTKTCLKDESKTKNILVDNPYLIIEVNREY